MRNRKFERERKLQKQYGKNPNQNLTQGIVVRHDYSQVDNNALSWWDDTGFNLNGVRISIWWIHPRMKYRDTIQDMAHTNVPYPDIPCIFELSNDDKIYKTVGKNKKRKKVIGYRATSLKTEVRKQWYTDLLAEENRLYSESNLSILPSIKIETLDWCRGVSICAPMEIHNVSDLHKLCDLVKALLGSQTTLATEFPQYTYDFNSWNKENPDSRNTDILDTIQLLK